MAGPCAACKYRRKGCKSGCVFAPYFPADNPQKFEIVYRVFGASKVSKFISNLHVSRRKEAIDSLFYEAEYRLRDPVFGCVGQVSVLRSDLAKFKRQIATVKKEIEAYKKAPTNPSQAADDVLGSPAGSPTGNSESEPSSSETP